MRAFHRAEKRDPILTAYLQCKHINGTTAFEFKRRRNMQPTSRQIKSNANARMFYSAILIDAMQAFIYFAKVKLQSTYMTYCWTKHSVEKVLGLNEGTGGLLRNNGC